MEFYSRNEFLFIRFLTSSGRVEFDRNTLDNNVDFDFERRGFNISYAFRNNFVTLGKLAFCTYNLHILRLW